MFDWMTILEAVVYWWGAGVCSIREIQCYHSLCEQGNINHCPNINCNYYQCLNRLITLPHFIFGQLFKHNYQLAGEHNYQIWLPMDQMSDSENRQPDIISLLVNFSCALGQIMTRYDFLWARRVILRNVQINCNLTKFYFVLTHHVQGWDSDLKYKSEYFLVPRSATAMVRGGGGGGGGVVWVENCVYFKCSRSKSTALFTIL